MIEINFEDFIPKDTLASLDVLIDTLVLSVAEGARAEWIRLAQENLSTSRVDYINGIQPVMMKGGVATIVLVGMLPNLIEQGMAERDMHDLLLGPKVPVAPPGEPGKRLSAAGGFYRAIPFRHATPGTSGAVGVPMGDPYKKVQNDAAELGKAVYALAKELAPTTSSPGKGTAYGGRLTPADMEAVGAGKLKPHHAVPIYQGMIREEKTYKSATQSQYTTFRTIAVDAQGAPVGSSPWIRPATRGKHFATQVGNFIESILPDAIEAFLKAAEGKA